MLYRVIGEEISTHRHVEITNLDAPDAANARQFATEIGINVSKIEPMENPMPEASNKQMNQLLVAGVAVGLVLLALALTYVGLIINAIYEQS